MRTLLITPYFDASLPSGGVLFSIDVVGEWLSRGREVMVLCSARERHLGELEPFFVSGRLQIREIATPEHVRFTHHFHEDVSRCARNAIRDFVPDVIHVHNTQGMFAAIHAALDWQDRRQARPDRVAGSDAPRVILTALDFGALCLNHYLHDGTDRPCSGPESTDKCQRCVLNTIHGSARIVAPVLPRSITRRLWPRFVRLDQIKSAPELHGTMHTILRRVDAIVAPSPVMADRMREYAGPDTQVREILYGVSPAKMLRPAKSMSDVVRLAFLGSSEPIKGLQVLLAAAEALLDNLPLQIRAIGNDAVAHMIRAASPRARRYVCASEPLFGERLAAEHANIDAVLVPSLWHENSPFVILESLANGTPVIASDTAGMRHLLEPDRTGWLVPPGEVEAWSAVLERAARERQHLALMSETAYFSRTTADFVDDLEELETGTCVAVSDEAGSVAASALTCES